MASSPMTLFYAFFQLVAERVAAEKNSPTILQFFFTGNEEQLDSQSPNLYLME